MSKLKNYELYLLNNLGRFMVLIFKYFYINRSVSISVKLPLLYLKNNKKLFIVYLITPVNEICIFALFFRSEEFADLEAEFKPSLLNSTVYVISMSLQLSTFAINYRVS